MSKRLEWRTNKKTSNTTERFFAQNGFRSI